jgi:hypothetical protein
LETVNAALDRVSSSIPTLARAAVRQVEHEAPGRTLPLASAQVLEVALARAGVSLLGSVDDRFGDAVIRDGWGGLWRAAEIAAETFGHAFNGMSTCLWTALLAQVDQPGKLHLLERATQYMTAGNVILEQILKSVNGSCGPSCASSGMTSLKERRRYVIARLLRGEDAPETLRGNDIPVASGYIVLALPTRELFSSGRPQLQDDWFTVRQNSAMLVLVPAPETGPRRRPDEIAHAEEAFERLRLDCPAGLAFAHTIKEMPNAVSDAQEVLTTLTKLGCATSGLYRLDDILFEATLCRSPEFAARLAGKLTPVVTHTPYLLDTLEAFLDSDCERRELARRLFIHPNTLNYRLKRIWELTGLSLTRVSDLCVLKASLVALRIIQESDEELGGVAAAAPHRVRSPVGTDPPRARAV